MLIFLMKRIAAGVVLIFAVATLTFFLMSVGGTDPARNILGEGATEAQVAAKSAELGLDQPLLVRYGEWLSHAVQGDFGRSWFTNEPVIDSLANKFPVSLSIVVTAIILTAIVSAVLGVTAAVRRGWVDRFVQFFAIFGFALPNFWVALVLVSVFAVSLRLLPATGYTPIATDPAAWALGLVLPVLALVTGTIASTAQQVRGATIDVLRQDYVRTLRSRGVSKSSLLFRHVLRNAAPPALTVLSLQFVGLLGGAIIIEKIFALPGIGSLAVSSTIQGDLPPILGLVVGMVVLVVLVNLLIDLATGWLNPKARLS
ncbi:ABC transporter permease [Agromyces atrinae]|uniref:ABC transporter permease n=1 Tax=Agromyces atrinae TaxID=592376 RepID=A0A4Q2MBD3_9MICO|nr:ABC transporter permease [Agromyces atrinae]NYD66721.1 peptide/nickel transport system permease protein [Agromyces atrinae]RXZ87381.1 ABC transporter permease [Agromyces atrinae]